MMARKIQKVFITGATGFVGSHLCEYILEHQPEVEIWAIRRWRSSMDNVRAIADRVHWIYADLTDLKSMILAFEKAQPDAVFHLAAQSYVMTSFDAPTDTLYTNIIGTLNLLEAIRLCKLNPVIHICSSSEVYGDVTQDLVPITESCRFEPASPYAVSKVGTDMIGLQYYLSYGLQTIRTRMFTHTGPRRGEVFVVSAFARQIARIQKGKQAPVVKVGNLKSIRTFADARDTVRAYWLLVERCGAGEVYNIGGARTMTVGEMLDMLLELAGLTGKVSVEEDPALKRPSDVTLQIPSNDKFIAETGWKPEIPFEQTLRDTLNYWLERV